jgi:hypothetical protein
MKFSIAPRKGMLVFAMAVLMAGCGGGGDMGGGGVAGGGVEAGGQAQMAAAAPLQAPAALTPAQFMDWVEGRFPQFVPAADKQDGFLFPFTYRYYPSTQNFVAVSTEIDDVAVYIYGEVAGWQLRRLGALSDFTCAVLPLNCVVGQPGSLTGHVVSTTDFHGSAPDHTQILGPHLTVAGDGIELTNGFGGFATIDISAASIRIIAAADQPFGYFELLRFADANGTISPIASVTVDPATNYAGFDASRLTFTTDRIDVNLTGLAGLQGQQILLNITFGAP